MQARHLWWAFAAVATLVGAGCGAERDETDLSSEDPVGANEDGLSTKADTFVTLRRDTRKCAYPRCGGYYVRDVNSNRDEQYVYALNFETPELDSATTRALRAEPEEVLLKGRLSPKTGQGLRRFIVREAYRGMPGVKPAVDATFYSVSERLIQCIQAPCDVYTATAVNEKDETVHFAEVDVGMSLMPLVQAEWLTQRIVSGQAIAAGHFLERAYDWVDGPGAPIWTLDASQVYLRLPEEAGPCPVFKLAACEDGKMMSYTRDADRCVVPVGCMEPVACDRRLPVCEVGYTLVSWVGEGGCPAYACDPAFISSEPMPAMAN